MYRAICVARSVDDGFKLKFYFGKTTIEAMSCALAARSIKFDRDFLNVSNLAGKTAVEAFEMYAALLDASMGADERWVSADDTKGAINSLLFPQSIKLMH